jgi:hypothetical protein
LAAKGQVEGIGTSPRLVAEDATGQRLVERRWPDDRGLGHNEFFRVIGGWLREEFGDMARLGVGHRVVHGAVDYAAPVRVDPAVLAKLEALCPLAPLHQPHNLAGIRAVAAVQPDLPQVACFDTAFHRGHPELADWFALPRRFHDEGIRRYGLHGLSYEYIASVLPEVAPEIAKARVVVGHLGSGASMCAMSGSKHRQHHGVHRARRPAHRHPLRRDRPGNRAASDPGLQHGRRCGRACAMFERLLALRNDVGLLAEEYDPRAHCQMGNFPQAFSHVALVNTAYNLTRGSRPGAYRA